MGVKVTNNAFGTLSAGITTSDTTITLDSGQGARFPTLSSGDYFFGTLVDTSNNLEIVKVTARSTDSMTVTRAQDNTTATAFAIGDRFELRPVAGLFEAIQDEASVDGITSSAAGTAITIDSSDNTAIENDLNVKGTLERNGTKLVDADSLRFPTASSDPTSGSTAGDVYYNTGTNLLRFYNGSNWNDISVDLSPFSNVLTTSLATSCVNVTEAGSSNITTYGCAAISLSGATVFGWHDGHDGNGTDYPAYWAVYLGAVAKPVNKLVIDLHSNSFGYFELQGSNDANTSGTFYNTGTWTSLSFDSGNSTLSSQNAGGQGSGYSDHTQLTYRYNNDVPYTHYRMYIKDSSKPSESLGTRYNGWAAYFIQLSRV